MTSVPARSQVIALPSGPLSLDRVRIMGILNRTPDSFYSAARHADLDLALKRAEEMIEEGANIIDIGGEKAGPGAPVSVEEELERVVPTVRAIRRISAISLSVDTIKPVVARAAIEAGADIINSIGGFEDPEMRRAAAETGAAAVIMHIQGKPRVAHPHPRYEDVVSEVRAFLEARAELCLDSGIEAGRIIIDPGPGFGKNAGHDLELMRHLHAFTALPYPLLLAVSRKGFIGDVLGVPPGQRLEGSLALAAWGVLRGARIVRTHDVRATRRVCLMTEAVLQPELVEG